MTPTTQRRSAAEWYSLVEEQTLSGQTIAHFCQNRALVQATFLYWRKKYLSRISPGDTNAAAACVSPGFVAVLPHSGTVGGGNILLRGRGGVEVEVPPGTPLSTLQTLIQALSC